jgi:hypothetical protein
MKTLVFLYIAILMIGCGNDDDGEANVVYVQDTPYSMAISKKSDLPDCDENNSKQLVYVKKEKQFYSCEADGWDEIDIGGPDSRDGAFWHDDKTGNSWQIHGADRTKAICPVGNDVTETGGFRDSDANDVREALRNGIFKYANIRVFVRYHYWVYSDDPDGEEYYNPGTSETKYAMNIAFSICLLKKKTE